MGPRWGWRWAAVFPLLHRQSGGRRRRPDDSDQDLRGDSMKTHDKPTHVEPAPAAVEPMPQTGCVICGSYEGEMPETVGHARWHVACGAQRPDLVAKAKARA